MRFLLLVFWFFLFVGCQTFSTQAPPPICHEERLVMDLGSGSFKSKAARFNTCTQQIEKIWWTESVKTGLREDLAKSRSNEISEEAAAKAFAVVQDWTQRIRGISPQARISGFATQVFREASNGATLISAWSQTLSVKLAVITAEQEGAFAFAAVKRGLPTNPKPLLVWDIGGGSQQWSWENQGEGQGEGQVENQGQIRVAKSELASVSFKNAILKDTRRSSANPLNKNLQIKGQRLAKKEARQIQAQLPNSLAEFTLVGVGGVWRHSLAPARSAEGAVTTTTLQALLAEREKQTDLQMNSNFAETEATNVLLVKTFLQTLNIPLVQVPLQDFDVLDLLLVEPMN